jgi:hypothetical protein
VGDNQIAQCIDCITVCVRLIVRRGTILLSEKHVVWYSTPTQFAVPSGGGVGPELARADGYSFLIWYCGMISAGYKTLSGDGL